MCEPDARPASEVDEQQATARSELQEFEDAVRSAAKNESPTDFCGLTQCRSTASNTGQEEPSYVTVGCESDFIERLEELAEDQLELLRHVQTLVAGQEDLARRFDQLWELSSNSSAVTRSEVNQLHSALLSQRRGMAVRAIFDQLVEPYERLRAMATALDAPRPPKNRRKKGREDEKNVRNQIQAVITILGRLIRDLGYEEFRAEVGEPFDPTRMSCCGYTEGEPGVVLKPVRPGYRAGDFIAVPAAVLIADPHVESSETK